jgi:hypothetical protein
MKIPRIDTLLVRNNLRQNDRAMRVPSDLGKPAANVLFQRNTPDCDSKNERLNFLA